ncbi:MAG: hypothetical protein EU539_08830 [Promethearchaeota archaeon]|nr:MAG: hypothetical protein EU539_08830 [Candidatus Lokiarchaeota archaeon]
MISRIFIIATGGVLCYSKNYSRNKTDQKIAEDDLIGGFLNAISSFAKETKVGEVRSLNFRNYNFIYSYDEEFGCMFIIVIDINDLEEDARAKLESMKNEFLTRYRSSLKNFKGLVSEFDDFDNYVEEKMYIPPKILLVGENGVGKSTILDLFPGETIIELDEDLVEIIQKPIKITGLANIKEFTLREIDLKELIDKSKLYRPLLNSVDIILLVTDSGANNLSRTKRYYSLLKPLVKRADFYLIANFQDSKESAFEPKKIKKLFDDLEILGFSAVQKDSKEKFISFTKKILKKSVLEKL